MYKGKKILALITARGGSQGIPGKNIKALNGLPLVGWSIKAAQGSQYVDRLILSTDDKEIAKISDELGCDVPFMRPFELARDTSGSMEVIMHALDQCGDGYDYLLLLQPTSPFRTAHDIDSIIEQCVDQNEDQVVSVARMKKHPQFLFEVNQANKLQPYISAEKQLRRQDMPPTYEHNGALYLSKIDYLREKQSYLTTDTVPFIMEGPVNLDLDTLEDWDLAEYYISSGKVKV